MQLSVAFGFAMSVLFCEFSQAERSPGLYVCAKCGATVRASKLPIHRACDSIERDVARGIAQPPEPSGPGTELKAIFTSLGIDKLEGCQCNAHAARMNAWGVAGSRQHFDEIVAWLRDGQDQFGWRDKIKAAASAVKSGLLGELRATDKWSDLTGWADPFPAIVELAIRRAEAKSTTESSSSLSTRDE